MQGYSIPRHWHWLWHLINKNQIKEGVKNESNYNKLMLSKQIGKLKVGVCSRSCFYIEVLWLLFHLASLKAMFEDKSYSYWNSKYFNIRDDFNSIWEDPSTHQASLNCRSWQKKSINLIVCKLQPPCPLPLFLTVWPHHQPEPTFCKWQHHKLIMYKLSLGIVTASKI